MRISYVTENTIDLASDINKSLNQTDGIIPMKVEALTPPTLENAVVGAYYVSGNKVISCDTNKSFWFSSEPEIIVFNGELYLKTSTSYIKVLNYSDAVLGLLACKDLDEMKNYLGIK